MSQHRDEISKLKAEHWVALKEAEESNLQKLRKQEEEIKNRHEAEKTYACKQEREREQQRYDDSTINLF